MHEHPRWVTVKEVKDELNKYSDDCLVFIQPHKYMIDYPFYIYQSGNKNIYFRFYDDSLLPCTFKMKIQAFIWKWRIKWWNLQNYKKQF